MKKLCIAPLLLALQSVVVFAADDSLVTRAANEIRQAKEAIASSCGGFGGQFMARHLSDAEMFLDLALHPQPPQNNGFYCAAACTSSTGVVDFRQSDGAPANFEAQARDAATQKVQAKFSCSWGLKVTTCSPQYAESVYDAAAACTTSTGKPELRQAKGGQGFSATEAATNARIAAQAAFGCSWGIVDVGASQELRQAYCTAACTSSTGVPDARQARGAEGRNRTEALVKSVAATQAAFSCSWGVAITECSEAP